MKSTFLILILLSIIKVNAQYYNWAKGLSGSYDEHGTCITTDSSGNVYVAGRFYGTTDFDPGTDSANITSAGDYDGFIAKYDANGNYVWAKSVGGTSTESANKIALDKTGNIYVTGSFKTTADFDPGAGIANLAATGKDDVFFAKYSSNGNYLWAKKIGSANSDIGQSIALDDSGNVYVCGEFYGTADFDPGAGTVNIPTKGETDIFIAKYDMNGNYLWAKTIGSTTFDRGYSIAISETPNGNYVILCGNFEGTADFDPGAGVSNLISSGFSDIFIAKYDAGGNYLWAKSCGGTGNDESYSIAVDSVGTVFITGFFEGTADFDPGTGTANLVSAGSADFVIASYNSNGNYVWAKSIGGTGNEQALGVVLNNSGSVFITGIFSGTVDFDAGIGTANLISENNSTDIFFCSYSSAGNFLWAKNLAGVFYDNAGNIAIDASGLVYITGSFAGTTNFNTGGSVELTPVSIGFSDAFIAKYSLTAIGIEESGNIYGEKIRIFPNPAKETITITGKLPLHYTIYDITGRKVLTEDIFNSGKSVSISLLLRGVYLYELSNPDEISRGKLIIE